MPTAGPFGVKGMNGSPLECRHGIFDKAALVQRVSVDGNLHIHVVGDRKTAIDGGRSRTPVLMKLQAARSGFDLLDETRGRACIAFAENAEIHGERVGGLEHPSNMPGSRRAGRGRRPCRRPGPPAYYCCEPRIERFLYLLRADVVNMRVDATGSDDAAFPGDHLGARTDDYGDMRLHIGIASFAYGGDAPVLDADIGLHDSPVIDNQRVGDDRIDCALAAGTLRLTHAIADDFPAPELHLLAVDREVLLHLDDEVGIREAHPGADRGAKHLRIGDAAHCTGHFRPTSVIQGHDAGTRGNAPMTA